MVLGSWSMVPEFFSDTELKGKFLSFAAICHTRVGPGPAHARPQMPGKLPALAVAPQADHMLVAGVTSRPYAGGGCHKQTICWWLVIACVSFDDDYLSLDIFYPWAFTDTVGHSAMPPPPPKPLWAQSLTPRNPP